MPSRSRGAPPAKQLSRHQRGLDHGHEVNRGRLMTRHVDGRRCWWCNKPMFRDPAKNWDRKPLHADHTRTRARYGIGNTHADRLLHDTCNKQRGNGDHDDERPALIHLAAPILAHDVDLGPLAMGWPWT
jgi:hypothetical protein